MKYAFAAAMMLATVTTASAQYQTRSYGGLGTYGGLGGYGTGSNPNSHYVQPKYNFGGTTQGYYRTNPNGTQYDNFGTRGNYNPYTGAYGTRTPRY